MEVNISEQRLKFATEALKQEANEFFAKMKGFDVKFKKLEARDDLLTKVCTVVVVNVQMD